MHSLMNFYFVRYFFIVLSESVLITLHNCDLVTHGFYRLSIPKVRFVEAGRRGSLKVDKKTGETVNWSNFLAPASGGDAEHSPWQPEFPVPDLQALNAKDVHTASQMWPMDSYNTTLLNHVHPPDWQDPNPNNTDGSSMYDLVVVGGGTGGLISAGGSAGIGAKVAMIEENMLGGDW
jgi:hypothetical protein